MYFPCLVTECKKPIQPGESGEISMWALCEEYSNFFSRGTKCELREGPNTLALGEIISEVVVEYYQDSE